MKPDDARHESRPDPWRDLMNMTGYKEFADVADYINAAPDNKEREARKAETFGIRYGVTRPNYAKTEARMLAHYGGTLRDYQRQLIEATAGMGLYAQLFGRVSRGFCQKLFTKQ